MTNPGAKEYRSTGVRQPVLLGLFSGTAIGVGYLLAGVPNVELMTLVVALAGAVLGPWLGAVCGVLAIGTYSLGSPFGLPVPILLAGQVLGYAITGIIGALAAKKMHPEREPSGRLRNIFLAGAAGFTSTLVYDLLTSIASIQAFGMDPLVTLTGAVPFVLIHLSVNTLFFALLFPGLSRRLSGLAQPSLQGKGQVMLAAFLGLVFLHLADDSLAQRPRPAEGPQKAPPAATATAESDSNSTLDEPAPARGPNGWRRPLWDPYAPTALQWLQWNTPWVTVQDGGLGAATVVLGEASTNLLPSFRRDGVPQGCGHILVDDPWLVSNQGLKISQFSMAPDTRTGNDGQVTLETADLAPDRAMSVYRGLKGPHETYHRGFSLLTPDVAWRVGFEFDESLDNEAYNFTEDDDSIFRSDTEFPGHAKVRSSRTRLIRQLNPESSVALEYSTGRKTKDSLPALDAEHQEIWSAGAAATMKSRSGSWLWRSVLFWNSRDTRWGDRPTSTGASEDTRLLEVMREGVELDLLSSPADVDSAGVQSTFSQPDWESNQPEAKSRVGLRYSRWEVLDTGDTDLEISNPAEISGQGETAQLSASSGVDAGPVLLYGTLAGSWDSHGGADLGGEAGVDRSSATSTLRLGVQRTGRAPRSDELLTPWLHDVNGRSLTVLPNSDLERERTWRVHALAGWRLLGFNLAVDGSYRRLSNGITWVASTADPDIGTLDNSLSMNSSRFTGSVGRQGRFLGWARIRLEGTWQNFDEVEGQASFLPPENYFRLVTMWENHFFQEDGILQLALYSTRREEMADPWDLTRETMLPQLTWHDLVVGFRLRGAHLSLAIRNLTDQKVKLSAGSYSNGREMDMRLHWVFPY